MPTQHTTPAQMCQKLVYQKMLLFVMRGSKPPGELAFYDWGGWLLCSRLHALRAGMQEGCLHGSLVTYDLLLQAVHCCGLFCAMLAAPGGPPKGGKGGRICR